jgi:hypothetical protein
MILTPLIREFILQFTALPLVVYIRTYTDKLMFYLSSGITFIIRSLPALPQADRLYVTLEQSRRFGTTPGS